ncbi:hypothetical protein ASD65_04820 [Microbacterium sp. Root61]|uniref:APC family permease n=1 Tax=Microbacterium sp. Root61 TaxID=1736570 RepID=UPI0006FE8873|nr:APC family permease [Microbacterium sp. Root61]KRA23818.1 hypothetical protein ASD65_04820 [Microbacterium sp. Root61]
MINAESAEPRLPITLLASADAPGRPGEQLQGKMGTLKLILTVLAMSAPLGAVAGVMPLVISEGNGAGAPATYLVMGVILMLFAVGFTTMARNFPRAGAFYAYITGGLGKPLGLSSAFLAQLGYMTLLVGTYAFFGDQAEVLMTSLFGFSPVPWWGWGAALFVAVTMLGHFNVELSGRVLSVMMVIEVCIVLIFNIPMLATGGPQGWQVESFTPAAFTSGSIGLAILFASATFLGFEGTAIYRNEVRNPDKTVPRATYLAIGFIAVFYVFSSWALVTFYGTDNVVAVAQENPSTMFASGLSYFAGPVVAEIMTCLVVTSLFAATLSAHNPMARYTFALARDGVYPAILGRVHGTHKSPAIASAVTSALTLVIIVPFILAGVGAVTFYSWMFGLGTYALLLCMAMACLAVIVYFRRVTHTERRWNTIIAPALGFVGLAVMLGISSFYFPLLIGGDVVLAGIFQGSVFALIILGIVLALVWRRTRPSVYSRIGGEEDTSTLA